MKWIISLALVCLMACQKPTASITPYFDLDSLLNNQVVLLSEGNYRLNKEIQKGAVLEKKVLAMDSISWSKELKIIRDFNPAQPKYTSAFEVVTGDKFLKYQLKPKVKAALKNFQISQSLETTTISGFYVEEKTIYSQSRKLEMVLVRDTLREVNLEMLQVRFPSDSLQFRIKYLVDFKN